LGGPHGERFCFLKKKPLSMRNALHGAHGERFCLFLKIQNRHFFNSEVLLVFEDSK
jgi:hypothetical protein